MPKVLYSKSVPGSDIMFGRFQGPVRAIIEHESDLHSKKDSLVDVLFNVEKSKRHSETISGETDFGPFQATREGASAENDSVLPTFPKTILHVPFMKMFTITKEMADDSVVGIASDITSKPKNMVRSYYRTRNQLAAAAVIHGNKKSHVFNKATIDLTTADELPLFSAQHRFVDEELFGDRRQSNLFSSDFSTVEGLRRTLTRVSNRMRNFKDENGNNLGYAPNVILLPCNRPDLEENIKVVVGSEKAAGSSSNDISIHYGNWDLVVLDDWELSEHAEDELMFMSKEANKNLLGSMFFDRHTLDVMSFIDPGTRNNVWSAYCRMGIGFTTWKHMSRCVSNASAVDDTTWIA
ncbi:MAG: hypothetical protein IKA64_01885 [Clostridia bacterium]|nr:hypothetical protein [Clostridia bacterium]